MYDKNRRSNNKHRIVNSKLVKSLRDSSNIEQVRIYEISDMMNQDPKEIF